MSTMRWMMGTSLSQRPLPKRGRMLRLSLLWTGIEDPGNKAKALSQVVDILVQMGQQAKAAEFARQALALIRSAGDETFIGEALVAAVQALVKAGEKQIAVEAIQETYRVAKSIADEENEGSGTNTLGVVAQALAEIGEHDQARAIAEARPDQFAKAQSLAKVTQALTQAGEKVKALALAKQTQAAIAEYGWASDNGQVVNTVVQALAQVGEYQAALAVARSIREDLAKAQIRQSAFNTLGTGALLLAPRDHGAILWNIYEAVMEIEGWWEAQ
jgi:tetratricopeptide (TPR) repeat protein